MKTKREIIKETIDFYSADPGRRAVNELGGCSYKMDDGRKCAVGRCLVFPLTGMDIGEGISRLLPDDSTNFSHAKFQPEYDGHEMEFWSALQRLHDATSNWTEIGLSEHGKREAERLLEQFV